MFRVDAVPAPTAPQTATATLTPESLAELDHAYAVLLRANPRTGRLRMLANKLATVSSDHLLTADITSWPTLNNHPFNWDRINEDDNFEYLHFVLRAHTDSRAFPVMLSAMRDKSTGHYRINLKRLMPRIPKGRRRTSRCRDQKLGRFQDSDVSVWIQDV